MLLSNTAFLIISKRETLFQQIFRGQFQNSGKIKILIFTSRFVLRNLIEKNAFEEVYDIYYLYNSESQKN